MAGASASVAMIFSVIIRDCCCILHKAMLRNIVRMVEEEDRLLFDAVNSRNGEEMKKIRSRMDDPCVDCSYTAICHLPHCTDCYVTKRSARNLSVPFLQPPIQKREKGKSFS